MTENIEIVKAIILSVASAMRANALIATKKKMPDVALILQTECNNLENAYQELDQCSGSSAESSDAIGTVPAHSNVSEPSQNQSSSSLSKDATVATDAASAAKLSWLPMSESVPPDGPYPIRLIGQSYKGPWSAVIDGKWTPARPNDYEYLPIHLIGEK